MDWSPRQAAALDAVSDWHRSGSSPLFRLFGYAGTGKTTLARHFAESIGGTVYYAAFTGKAASVLRTAGCVGATTIHSLIYKPKEKSRAVVEELSAAAEVLKEQLRDAVEPLLGKLTRELGVIERKLEEEKRSLRRPSFTLNYDSPIQGADLIIIDECSMVDERIGEDLLSFRKPILVLGDPAQLPPVAGAGYFTAQPPDLLLTEIHRQARDNPIIDLATRVRMGEALEHGNYGDSRVVRWNGEVDPSLILDADQLLVGTNKFRRACNARFRTLLSRDRSPFPLVGDKIVCLRNNHEIGLLNGVLHSALADAHDYDEYLELTLTVPDSDEGLCVAAHRNHFLGEEVPWWCRKDAEEFDYGYALTVHKAQGSQWGAVTIFDESGKFRENRKNWLYTAVTRAAETVTIIK